MGAGTLDEVGTLAGGLGLRLVAVNAAIIVMVNTPLRLRPPTMSRTPTGCTETVAAFSRRILTTFSSVRYWVWYSSTALMICTAASVSPAKPTTTLRLILRTLGRSFLRIWAFRR